MISESTYSDYHTSMLTKVAYPVASSIERSLRGFGRQEPFEPEAVGMAAQEVRRFRVFTAIEDGHVDGGVRQLAGGAVEAEEGEGAGAEEVGSAAGVVAPVFEPVHEALA